MKPGTTASSFQPSSLPFFHSSGPQIFNVRTSFALTFNRSEVTIAISALAKKLRLHAAHRALILNAPNGYLDLLGELPEEINIEGEPSGKCDFAHLFVKERAELEQFIDQLLQAIEYDAILWISYPKGSSGVKTDLNRDKLWKALSDKDIRPVAQVSINEVWSAMRFRPTEQVGG